MAQRVAFYDFDGTLVTSNVVTRYAWLARGHPNKMAAVWRYGKTLAGVPLWLALDAISRRLFNEVFYRQYKGLRANWLEETARRMWDEAIAPTVFAGTNALLEGDRAEGFRLVLVSGGLDFAVRPAAEALGFDDVIANRLEYRDGVATGEIVAPLLAGEAKVAAMHAYCREGGFDPVEARGYSDSKSDLPMLLAVGSPRACNPDKGLRKEAVRRGWPVLDLG